MATKNFSHSGRVLSLEGRKVRIGFESRGACAGCKASSKCGMVDSSTREVEVEIAENESYNIGDVVDVAISYQMGIMSVVVAYIIPLIILLSTLALAVSFGVMKELRRWYHWG